MLDSHIMQVYYCINTVIHLYLYLARKEVGGNVMEFGRCGTNLPADKR